MSDDIFDELNDDELTGVDPFADVTDVDSGADPSSGERTVEEFEAELERQIRILLTPKQSVEARVEAAYWLGDSGAPKAIRSLRTAYMREKNPEIKSAAEFALGQFRALDQAIVRDEGEAVQDALGRDENKWVIDLLKEIALYGRRTRKLRVPVRVMLMLQGVLLLTFGGLVAANLSMGNNAPGGEISQIAPPTPDTVSPVRNALAQAQANLGTLRADAEALDAQLTANEQGQQLFCGYPFVNPTAVIITPQVENAPAALAALTRYNDLLARYQGARTGFDNACGGTTIFMATSVRVAAQTALDDVLAQIPALETELVQAVSDLAANPPPGNNLPGTPGDNASPNETPQLVPTNTELPTLEPSPTPGLTQLEINSHAGAMLTIIDEAQRQNAQLLEFWTNAQNGDTSGCRQLRPAIPENYQLPVQDGILVPDLKAATDNVNGGLDLSRLGWDLFTGNCQAGTTLDAAATGISTAETARGLFDLASAALNQLTGR